MNIIKVSNDELRTIIDKDQYEEVESKKHYRHNGEHITIIFNKDNKSYMLTYTRFEDDGISWEGTYSATEVHQVEVLKKEWRVVE